MKGKLSKLVLVMTILAVVACFFIFDLGQYLTLGYFKEKQQVLEAYYLAHTWVTVFAYMGIYILVTALSLPGATVMSLVGGAIFGLWIGTLIISFASSIGATLAFLVARFLLRDFVQSKFGDKLQTINEGIEKEGVFYLFTLRLVPLFPFFVINLVMGLTPIRTVSFYIVSQIGMLAGTLVYVNAGTQIAKLESVKGILSPELLFSFALLGIFPLAAKKIVDFVKTHRALKEN